MKNFLKASGNQQANVNPNWQQGLFQFFSKQIIELSKVTPDEMKL